jgi:hypothetical protein
MVKHVIRKEHDPNSRTQDGQEAMDSDSDMQNLAADLYDVLTNKEDYREDTYDTVTKQTGTADSNELGDHRVTLGLDARDGVNGYALVDPAVMGTYFRDPKNRPKMWIVTHASFEDARVHFGGSFTGGRTIARYDSTQHKMIFEEPQKVKYGHKQPAVNEMVEIDSSSGIAAGSSLVLVKPNEIKTYLYVIDSSNSANTGWKEKTSVTPDVVGRPAFDAMVAYLEGHKPADGDGYVSLLDSYATVDYYQPLLKKYAKDQSNAYKNKDYNIKEDEITLGPGMFRRVASEGGGHEIHPLMLLHELEDGTNEVIFLHELFEPQPTEEKLALARSIHADMSTNPDKYYFLDVINGDVIDESIVEADNAQNRQGGQFFMGNPLGEAIHQIPNTNDRGTDADFMCAMVRFGELRTAASVDLLNVAATFKADPDDETSTALNVTKDMIDDMFGEDKRDTLSNAAAAPTAAGAPPPIESSPKETTYSTEAGGGLKYARYTGDSPSTADDVTFSIAEHDDNRNAIRNPIESPYDYNAYIREHGAGRSPLLALPRDDTRRHSALNFPLLKGPNGQVAPYAGPEVFTAAGLMAVADAYVLPEGWSLPTELEVLSWLNKCEGAHIDTPTDPYNTKAPFYESLGMYVTVVDTPNMLRFTTTAAGNQMMVVYVETHFQPVLDVQAYGETPGFFSGGNKVDGWNDLNPTAAEVGRYTYDQMLLTAKMKNRAGNEDLPWDTTFRRIEGTRKDIDVVVRGPDEDGDGAPDLTRTKIRTDAYAGLIEDGDMETIAGNLNDFADSLDDPNIPEELPLGLSDDDYFTDEDRLTWQTMGFPSGIMLTADMARDLAADMTMWYKAGHTEYGIGAWDGKSYSEALDDWWYSGGDQVTIQSLMFVLLMSAPRIASVVLEKGKKLFMADESTSFLVSDAKASGVRYPDTAGRTAEMRSVFQFYYNFKYKKADVHKFGVLLAESRIGKSALFKGMAEALATGYYPDRTPVEAEFLGFFGEIMYIDGAELLLEGGGIKDGKSKALLKRLKYAENYSKAHPGRICLAVLDEGIDYLTDSDDINMKQGQTAKAIAEKVKTKDNLFLMVVGTTSAYQGSPEKMGFLNYPDGGQVKLRFKPIPIPLPYDTPFVDATGTTRTTRVANPYVGMAETPPRDVLSLLMRDFKSDGAIGALVAEGVIHDIQGRTKEETRLLREQFLMSIIISADHRYDYPDPNRSLDELKGETGFLGWLQLRHQNNGQEKLHLLQSYEIFLTETQPPAITHPENIRRRWEIRGQLNADSFAPPVYTQPLQPGKGKFLWKPKLGIKGSAIWLFDHTVGYLTYKPIVFAWSGGDIPFTDVHLVGAKRFFGDILDPDHDRSLRHPFGGGGEATTEAAAPATTTSGRGGGNTGGSGTGGNGTGGGGTGGSGTGGEGGTGGTGDGARTTEWDSESVTDSGVETRGADDAEKEPVRDAKEKPAREAQPEPTREVQAEPVREATAPKAPPEIVVPAMEAVVPTQTKPAAGKPGTTEFDVARLFHPDIKVRVVEVLLSGGGHPQQVGMTAGALLGQIGMIGQADAATGNRLLECLQHGDIKTARLLISAATAGLAGYEGNVVTTMVHDQSGFTPGLRQLYNQGMGNASMTIEQREFLMGQVLLAIAEGETSPAKIRDRAEGAYGQKFQVAPMSDVSAVVEGMLNAKNAETAIIIGEWKARRDTRGAALNVTDFWDLGKTPEERSVNFDRQMSERWTKFALKHNLQGLSRTDMHLAQNAQLFGVQLDTGTEFELLDHMTGEHIDTMNRLEAQMKLERMKTTLMGLYERGMFPEWVEAQLDKLELSAKLYGEKTAGKALEFNRPPVGNRTAPAAVASHLAMAVWIAGECVIANSSVPSFGFAQSMSSLGLVMAQTTAGLAGFMAIERAIGSIVNGVIISGGENFFIGIFPKKVQAITLFVEETVAGKLVSAAMTKVGPMVAAGIILEIGMFEFDMGMRDQLKFFEESGSAGLEDMERYIVEKHWEKIAFVSTPSLLALVGTSMAVGAAAGSVTLMPGPGTMVGGSIGMLAGLAAAAVVHHFGEDIYNAFDHFDQEQSMREGILGYLGSYQQQAGIHPPVNIHFTGQTDDDWVTDRQRSVQQDRWDIQIDAMKLFGTELSGHSWDKFVATAPDEFVKMRLESLTGMTYAQALSRLQVTDVSLAGVYDFTERNMFSLLMIAAKYPDGEMEIHLKGLNKVISVQADPDKGTHPGYHAYYDVEVHLRSGSHAGVHADYLLVRMPEQAALRRLREVVRTINEPTIASRYVEAGPDSKEMTPNEILAMAYNGGKRVAVKETKEYPSFTDVNMGNVMFYMDYLSYIGQPVIVGDAESIERLLFELDGDHAPYSLTSQLATALDLEKWVSQDYAYKEGRDQWRFFDSDEKEAFIADVNTKLSEFRAQNITFFDLRDKDVVAWYSEVFYEPFKSEVDPTEFALMDIPGSITSVDDLLDHPDAFFNSIKFYEDHAKGLNPPPELKPELSPATLARLMNATGAFDDAPIERTVDTDTKVASLKATWLSDGGDYQDDLMKLFSEIFKRDNTNTDQRGEAMVAIAHLLDRNPGLRERLIVDYNLDRFYVENLTADNLLSPFMHQGRMYHYDSRAPELEHLAFAVGVDNGTYLGEAVKVFEAAMMSNDFVSANAALEGMRNYGYTGQADAMQPIVDRRAEEAGETVNDDHTIPRLKNETNPEYVARCHNIWADRLALYGLYASWNERHSFSQIKENWYGLVDQAGIEYDRDDDYMVKMMRIAAHRFQNFPDDHDYVLQALADPTMANVTHIRDQVEQFQHEWVFNNWVGYQRGYIDRDVAHYATDEESGEVTTTWSKEKVYYTTGSGRAEVPYHEAWKDHRVDRENQSAKVIRLLNGADGDWTEMPYDDHLVMMDYLANTNLIDGTYGPMDFNSADPENRSEWRQSHVEKVLFTMFAADPEMEEAVLRRLYGDQSYESGAPDRVKDLPVATYGMLVRLSMQYTLEYMQNNVSPHQELARATKEYNQDWYEFVQAVDPSYVSDNINEEPKALVGTYLRHYMPQFAVIAMSTGEDITDPDVVRELLLSTTPIGWNDPTVVLSDEFLAMSSYMIQTWMSAQDYVIEEINWQIDENYHDDDEVRSAYEVLMREINS